MRLSLPELEGVKPEILVTHFQSNGHKASVRDLISFIPRDMSFPYLVDKEKLRKDIESEKERERGRPIMRMLLDITTTLRKQGLAFREKFCGRLKEHRLTFPRSSEEMFRASGASPIGNITVEHCCESISLIRNIFGVLLQTYNFSPGDPSASVCTARL
ncbi:hypothetical protein QYM36_016739 [Artemia franciscana]|uniref:Uncharacterized protein n=1 Tax=Artemia franciscana TaxID=6661 RepID=A0AA88H463_ARTSF|nr:hypothetical protein QYM36_016739 [Artemia franciscana]